MSSDLTFITNEKNQNLKDRFEVLIKDTKFFDCLVGFFYTSGFYAIYKSLEATEKIRVLIGISTSRQTYDLLNRAVTDLSACAVPAPQRGRQGHAQADVSVARSGETLRQSEWRDELLNNGVRGKGGQYLQFSRVEPMPGTRYIQAEAETKSEKDKERQRVFIVFGPEHAPMEQRQVALALDEAQSLRPKAGIILFAAFQFDPEAAKDIDEMNWPGVTLLRVQMNADLFTEDLKKKRTSDDSFWLLGQPDVRVKKIETCLSAGRRQEGDNEGKFQVEVKGFDYYDTKTGNVISGNDKNIAVWMLDPDYDGRSLFPRQVFFPMSSDAEGWSKLAKNLKAEIDPELIEAYRGTVSLPFLAGEYKQCAVKIVDDRGIESLRILHLKG